MGILLWILQILLALVSLGAGIFHILLPPDMPAEFGWMFDIPTVPNIIIGVLEIAAGLGLILPGATRIQTRLVPLAALGFALTMVGAIIFHAMRSENIVTNVVWLVLALVVAYGRWRIRPFTDRSAAAA